MDKIEELSNFHDACCEALEQGLSIEDCQSILKDAFDYYDPNSGVNFHDACREAFEQGLSIEDCQSVLKDVFDYYDPNDNVEDKMNFKKAAEKFFGEDAKTINNAVDDTLEEQKSTYLNVSVDQLISLWNIAFEAGYDKG